MLFLSLMVEPVTIIVGLIILTFIAALLFRRKWSEILVGLAVVAANSLLVWVFLFLFNRDSINLFHILLITSLLSSIMVFATVIYKRIAQLPLVVGMFFLSVLFTLSVDYVFDEVLASHQRDRIENLIGVESDPLGAGYNVNQSKIAIGSGGFYGKGFLQGTQTKYNFVPEQSTDFIFCTVGEEWGFIGSSLIVLAFLFLLIRLIILAERQRSVFSRVFGYCVASILFFHFAINIGMTIGLAPVIGIPLPFFSYGGSSLWFFTMLLFVFLRLDSNRSEQLH